MDFMVTQSRTGEWFIELQFMVLQQLLFIVIATGLRH